MGRVVDFNYIFFGRHEQRHKIITVTIFVLIIAIMLYYGFRPAGGIVNKERVAMDFIKANLQEEHLPTKIENIGSSAKLSTFQWIYQNIDSHLTLGYSDRALTYAVLVLNLREDFNQSSVEGVMENYFSNLKGPFVCEAKASSCSSEQSDTNAYTIYGATKGRRGVNAFFVCKAFSEEYIKNCRGGA